MQKQIFSIYLKILVRICLAILSALSCNFSLLFLLFSNQISSIYPFYFEFSAFQYINKKNKGLI